MIPAWTYDPTPEIADDRQTPPGRAPPSPYDPATRSDAGQIRSTASTYRIDLLTDHVITFADLARGLPCRRQGRPTHVSTIHRWRVTGLNGVRLAAVRVGSVWVTTLEAYQAF